MSEPSTTRLTCKACRAEFERNPNGGRKPIYCPACRPIKGVIQRAEANAKLSPTVPCVDCGDHIPRNNRVREPRCEPCKARRQEMLARQHVERILDKRSPNRNADPICKDCGITFERAVKRGRRPDFCPACAKARILAAARAYIAKTYVKRVPDAPETFTCVDCSGPFEFQRSQGRVPVRCRQCQARRTQALDKETRQKRPLTGRKFAPGERRYPCTICRAEIVCKPAGRKPEFCDSCRKKRAAAKAREMKRVTKLKPPRQIICMDCGANVQLPLRGASQQKRCAACAIKAARVIQKRMGRERRAWKYGADAEHFDDIEIYERDRWECRLCGKRINKRLRHPHPMSASLDHVIPYTKGGHHTRANVQASHLTCNLQKYNLGGGEQLMLIG